MAQAIENGPPTPHAPVPPVRGATRPAKARRTRVVVRKVGPLSVLKFSLLFYFCVMLIIYFALMIIYWLLGAVGAIDSTERLLGYVFATGDASGPQPIHIDGGEVFFWLFLGGCGAVVIWSLINVFVTFLYNLISDVVGGIEVTLGEKR
jgi:Transmembrane domain of unknown function (DUF3566)